MRFFWFIELILSLYLDDEGDSNDEGHDSDEEINGSDDASSDDDGNRVAAKNPFASLNLSR